MLINSDEYLQLGSEQSIVYIYIYIYIDESQGQAMGSYLAVL